MFSLKQSGAPLGGLIAGLLVPAMVVNFGWQGAIVLSVMIGLLAVVAIQPLRARLDDDRDPTAALAFASPWHAVRKVLRDVPLRRLTVVAFCLTNIQAIVMAFLVIILVKQVELEFTLAGAIFAASQAAGAALRITMGWIADRALGTRATLVMLGLASSVALVALTTLGPQSPLPLVIALSVTAGSLCFGWNGVFLAEVASLAAPHEVGAATAAHYSSSTLASCLARS